MDLQTKDTVIEETVDYSNYLQRKLLPCLHKFIDGYIDSNISLEQIEFLTSIWLDSFIIYSRSIYIKLYSEQSLICMERQNIDNFKYIPAYFGWEEWTGIITKSNNCMDALVKAHIANFLFTGKCYELPILKSKISDKANFQKSIFLFIERVWLKLSDYKSPILSSISIELTSRIKLFLRTGIITINNIFPSLPNRAPGILHRNVLDKRIIESKDKYEDWLVASLHLFLPLAYVEDINQLDRFSISLGYRSASLSMTSWVSNEFYRFWVSKNIFINKDFNFIIARHGGGSSLNYINLIEEKYFKNKEISKAPNFKIYTSRKIIPSFVKSSTILVPLAGFSENLYKSGHIGFTYKHRETYIEEIIKMLLIIDQFGRQILLRPYPHDLHTAHILARNLRKRGINFRVSNFKNEFKKEAMSCRATICTYPETTFAELLALGLPVCVYAKKTFNLSNSIEADQLINSGVWHPTIEKLSNWLKSLSKLENPNDSPNSKLAINDWLRSIDVTTRSERDKWLLDFCRHAR